MQKIIPIMLCRGGSKGILRKNIKELNNKPLLSYSLTETLKVFPRVYLSTEDPEITEVATRYGATVLSRPLFLAQDESKSIEVVKYHLKELRKFEGTFEAIILINTCTPFLKAKDIQSCIDILEKEKCDSVTSLVEDFSAHPSKVCYLIGNKIYSVNSGYEFKTGERQKLSQVYRRNTCLYLASIKTIKTGSFFGKNTRGYIMDVERSLDINSPHDFLMAELYMKYLHDNQTN